MTCDLAAPDAAEQLARHRAHRLFRGVRDMGPAARFGDPTFRRGYAELGRTGGLFFHTVGPENTEAALDLVRSHPGTGFVLDQAGMPPADLTAGERHAVMAGTAERVFGI